MTNEELVCSYQHGENEVIEQLYFDNMNLIRSIAKRYPADLEDLMQEAYFPLIQAAESYKPEKEVMFSTWFVHALKRHYYRITNSRYKDLRIPEYRMNRILKLKAIPEGTPENVILMMLEWTESEYQQTLKDIEMLNVSKLETELFDNLTVADTIESIEKGFEDAEKRLCNAVLWAEVDKLPEKERLAIRKRFIDNEPFTEIAEKLGIKYNTLMMKIKNAFRQLKRNKRIRELAKDYEIYSKALKGTSAASFRYSGTSATERVAIDLYDYRTGKT